MDPRSERSRTPATKPIAADAGARLDTEQVVDGRYRIEALLGAGAMGTVYQATHLSVGRAVAIKVLAPEWAAHASMPDRFRDEARAASAIGHPNIVEVFDAGQLADGRPYLVMELLPGSSLAQAIDDDGAFSVERACPILRAIARALAAAHDAGVIHRDLKPENVMLVPSDARERVKVLDFGVAAQTLRREGRRTNVGTVMGTAEYMSPEQILGQDPTPAFDIYALGVIAFEMLSGKVPIGGTTTDEIMSKKLETRAPSLSSVRSDLPADLVALVDACLSEDPAQRPATGRVVDDRLAAIERRASKTSAERSAMPAIPATEASRTRGTWLGLGLGGVFLVAAVIAGLDANEPASVPRHPNPPVAEARDAIATPASDRVLREPPPAASAPTPGEAPAVPTLDPAAAASPSAGTGPARRPATAPPRAGTRIECSEVRARAELARERYDWRALLRHVDARGCFKPAERQRLRTKAYMELEDFDRCAATGRGAADPEVRRWAQLCERRHG